MPILTSIKNFLKKLRAEENLRQEFQKILILDYKAAPVGAAFYGRKEIGPGEHSGGPLRTKFSTPPRKSLWKNGTLIPYLSVKQSLQHSALHRVLTVLPLNQEL